MRSRSLLLGTLVLAGLVLASMTAAAHEPEEAHVEDPQLRNLHLISTAPASGANATPEARAGTAGFALSVNASETSAPSRQFTIHQQPLVGCFAPCVQPNKAVRFQAPYAGDDFEVEHADAYTGQLRFAWTYHSNTPPIMGGSNVGYVMVHLMVAGEDYGTAHHPLYGTGGDVTLDLSFVHSHDCPEGRHHVHNGSGCREAGSSAENETLTPVYAHDFQLMVTIQPANDFLRSPLGGRLSIKMDTAGASFVQVREVPPPAPVEEAVDEEAFNDEVMIDATYTDADGDGEVDPDELRFVPGVSPALVLATVGLLGLAVRRLRK